MAVAQNRLQELVGSTIWFYDSRSSKNKGTVTAVMGVGHASVRIEELGGMPATGYCTVHANDIYLTEKELDDYNRKRH